MGIRVRKRGSVYEERELGIARCGLACCLCNQSDTCKGCDADTCSGVAWCENRRCSKEKEVAGCYACEEECSKGLLAELKPNAFRLFIKRYGMEKYKEKEEPRLQAAIAEYKEIGRQFEVSNDCLGCGSCVKVCPVGNIQMANGKPAFGGNCQQCMGCIQWCPKRAIDYQHTAGERKRYHHSKVTIGEMMK